MESGRLAPPTLQVNTQHRQRTISNADTITSTTSDPFRTPVSPLSDVSPSNASTAVNDPETALLADPGTEADFQVDNNPFAFSPGQLNKLFNPKSLKAFQALGGLEGIARGLQSDTHSGLSVDEAGAPRQITFDQAVHSLDTDKKTERHQNGTQPFEDRIRVYGRNTLPPKKATPLWRLVWNAYNDTVLIVLTIAAAISLALGLYETLSLIHI